MMIDAVTCFDTRTGIPSQPVVDTTSELIDTSQIEEIGYEVVEVVQLGTQVEFKTIGS